LEGGGIPLLFNTLHQLLTVTSSGKVRWQTGNGANLSLFWARDAIGILPKKAEVIISGALFLWFLSFWTNKKKGT
jgi:hypothetical protein